MNQNWKPEGYHSLTPFLIVPATDTLIPFYQSVFQARELSRHHAPDSAAILHAELLFGESILEIGDANPRYPASPVALHHYVPSAAAVYERAVTAGARILYDLTTQDYGDQEFALQDPAGNRWYVATHTRAAWRPEGLNDINPLLHLHDAPAFLAFAQAAFAATPFAVHQTPSGRILNAILRFDDAALECSEAHGPYQPLPANLHLYVPDADAGYRQALSAGAVSILEPYDAPYGDRSSGVRDPFGNTWWIHTRLFRR